MISKLETTSPSVFWSIFARALEIGRGNAKVRNVRKARNFDLSEIAVVALGQT